MKKNINLSMILALFLSIPGLAFSTQTPTPTADQRQSDVPVIDKAQQVELKGHFDEGMKDFNSASFEFALPELVASTSVTDVYAWQTWYVKAYTTLGIIYEFHSKAPKNKAYSYMYYSMALARDPKNITANTYIKDVQSAKDDAKALRPNPTATPLADGSTPQKSDTWIPAPIPKDTGRQMTYAVNTVFKSDAGGSTLETLGDILVHKRLDQYSTTGDLWIRVDKTLSSSDTIGNLDLWEGKVTFLEPWMQLSLGRLDIFSTVSPGSFFGNYPMMGLHRVDGVFLVLPLFVRIGIDNLDSYTAPPTALTLFYTPSLLEAQDVQLDTDQAFFFSQLRIRFNAFGFQTTVRGNMGWTGTNYFTYSSLNGGFTFSVAADVAIDNNLSLYGEFGDQNPTFFSSTDVVMGGVRLSKMGTWGPFSWDSLCIEAQFPLENNPDNIFSGGNAFDSSLAQNATTTFYGGAKFRLQDIFFNLGVTNNLDDFTLNRITSVNSSFPVQGQVGPGRETELGIPLLSSSSTIFAFTSSAGINF